MNDKEKLYKRIQEIEVFKKGNFTLSSGKKSNYYIDGRLISLDPTGSVLISKIFQKALLQYTLVDSYVAMIMLL